MHVRNPFRRTSRAANSEQAAPVDWQAIGLTAVAWMVTAHPRRSAENRRSWREARNRQRSPAVAVPRFDPDWANNRKDNPDA